LIKNSLEDQESLKSSFKFITVMDIQYIQAYFLNFPPFLNNKFDFPKIFTLFWIIILSCSVIDRIDLAVLLKLMGLKNSVVVMLIVIKPVKLSIFMV